MRKPTRARTSSRLGVVLYEMLTGRKAFEGKSQASLLGAILKTSRLRSARSSRSHHSPSTISCARSRERSRGPISIGHDLLLQLRWIAEGGSAAAVPPAVGSRRRSREWFAWTIAAVLGAIAVGAEPSPVVHLRETPAPAEPFVFTIAAAENSTLVTPPQFAISLTAGKSFLGLRLRRLRMLWVRPLATLAARARRARNERAHRFGRRKPVRGILRRRKTQKVDVSGGSPTELCVRRLSLMAARGIAQRHCVRVNAVRFTKLTQRRDVHARDALGKDAIIASRRFCQTATT